ncbi:hypothetical protein QR680_000373 [Steinernema hermaphroditum]|uniref:Uncharacterized protein n=1 Tax=Steinernema hermaphroditum TaxID=289476 RepID=A0AA39GX45_9BILA|nr:hypothetical protein QR680_000373 [Steinernema hermaphroditum]
MAHQFRAGTVDEYTEYIELWDVGSSLMHRRASSVFLEGASGVILVHDLTNRKSEENLCSQWLPMLNNDRNARLDSTIASMNESLAFQPIIDVETPDRSLTMSSFESINLDARKPLTPGTSGYLIIANFFDSVIKKTAAPSSFDRRRKHL